MLYFFFCVRNVYNANAAIPALINALKPWCKIYSLKFSRQIFRSSSILRGMIFLPPVKNKKKTLLKESVYRKLKL